MKVTTQTLDNRQIQIAIEVEDERVQQALQRTARKISEQINIPGFRRGKAPYNIVVRTVGQETLYDEMFKELGPQLLEEALQDADFVPYRPGEMSDMQFNPFSFKIIFPLPPLVDLGDYRNLRVPFVVPPAPDEQIDAVLYEIQRHSTIVEPAGAGPAEWGHIVVLDISAVLEGGESLDFSNIADESGYISFLLDEKREPLAPGFAANIVGMHVGEEKTFELVFPPDFEVRDLQGMAATFTVRLNDLKKLTVPPLDDALAQAVGNFDSLDQLRAALRAQLEQTLAVQAEAAYADACLARLAETATIEYPPVALEEELDRLIQEVEERLKKQKMSLQEMLKIKKQTMEDYRREMTPRAVTRLRQGLAFGKFIELEKLLSEADKLSPELVDAALARLKAICKGEAVEAPTDAAQTEQGEPQTAAGQNDD